MSGFLSENRPIRTLREILSRLRETYCGNIGYEVGVTEDELMCRVGCWFPYGYCWEPGSRPGADVVTQGLDQGRFT